MLVEEKNPTSDRPVKQPTNFLSEEDSFSIDN